MDNRTGFRHRGHAYLAHQARTALGVAGENQGLAEIPVPLVHTALGAAVCGVALLLRPQILGFGHSALASGALAILTGAVLVGYDVLVYPRDRRPGVAGAALPVAAVASFATVLAGVQSLSVRVIGGLVASLVIGGVPHLAARRASEREGWLGRLLRDVAGVAVLAPVLVAGVSPVLPPLSRVALVGVIAALVSFDALRSEPLPVHRAAAGAVGIGAVLAGAAAGVGVSAQPGTRAAVLLILWYGLRGFAGGLASGQGRRTITVVEYVTFVLVAGGALSWIAARP